MSNEQHSIWPETSRSSHTRRTTPVCLGLILGALLSGITFATFLTLYLRKAVPIIETSTHFTNTSTAATTTATTTIAIFNVNLITNGNGETGTCSLANETASPPGWNVSGPISQIYYNNTFFGDQSSTIIPQNERGLCYIMGYQSAMTSMWQTINLTNQVDSGLLDSQTVKFNLSAWLGGITVQNDSAVIDLTFLDQNNQMVGSIARIGPVLAADRGNISSFIPKQTSGFVPSGARSATVLVNITRYTGTNNNGDVDNMNFYLYQ
ncbi:unnamed protein product [Adineta ricciae]|uniref:Uncharacterized protein n=1 Tax=Adineta ricciae TaxID=249248 RepID=A0A814FMC4_ADIRI|nr:unnamed protein product [Adineta ricciae]CAF0983254.1 unnamed protein product [Adineta ricciae]